MPSQEPLKALCFSNATQSAGQIGGRDLDGCEETSAEPGQGF